MTDQAPTPDSVVVPVEPTEAMLEAWHEAVAKGIFGENGDDGKQHAEYIRDAYRAMLAARPAATPGSALQIFADEVAKTGLTEDTSGDDAYNALSVIIDYARQLSTQRPDPEDTSGDLNGHLFRNPITVAKDAATPGGEREEIARIIDPMAFDAGYDEQRACVQNDIDRACEEARAKAEAILAALSRPAPVAVVLTGISLDGIQGEPAGMMTVKAHLSDGSEVVLIRDNGNVISHWKSTEGIATPTPEPAAARGGGDADWQSVAMWMGFSASAIKSGEAWSAQCQQHYDEARVAFARLNAPALSAKGGS